MDPIARIHWRWYCRHWHGSAGAGVGIIFGNDLGRPAVSQSVSCPAAIRHLSFGFGGDR